MTLLGANGHTEYGEDGGDFLQKVCNVLWKALSEKLEIDLIQDQ